MINIKLYLLIVECSIANIELASTIDATDFESKVKKLEKMLKAFDQRSHRDTEEEEKMSD